MKPLGAGLLDTSVVIDLDSIDPDVLPELQAISAITLAELGAGPHATDDLTERAIRQDLRGLTAASDSEPARSASSRCATPRLATHGRRYRRLHDPFLDEMTASRPFHELLHPHRGQ